MLLLGGGGQPGVADHYAAGRRAAEAGESPALADHLCLNTHTRAPSLTPRARARTEAFVYTAGHTAVPPPPCVCVCVSLSLCFLPSPPLTL